MTDGLRTQVQQLLSVGTSLTKTTGYLLEDNWSRVVIDAIDPMGMYGLIPWHARTMTGKARGRMRRWRRADVVHMEYCEDKAS